MNGHIDGRVLSANDEFLRIVGRTREELEAGLLRWDRITPPEWAEADARGIAAALERGTCTPYRKEYVRPDGTRVPVIVGYSVFPEEGGESIAFILDITDQVRAEEDLWRLNAELENRVAARTAALAEANRELEAFSYSVSHDLRAPLRAIDGFARILSEDYGPTLDDEARRIIGVIRAGATKMGLLIDDLLGLARVGRGDLAIQSCDMSALARKAVEREPDRGEVDVRIGDLPPTSCDPNLMLQVWTNLVANAFKFTRGRDGRRVSIDAERRDDEVIYRVRDNGAGYDPRHGERLFLAFQRLHLDDEFEGTGIGLAIVRRIVERHGGSAGSSSKPGEGAEFRFSLPT